MSENIGPQLPPGFERKRKQKLPVGPLLPPSKSLKVEHVEQVETEEKESDDDVYGPKIPMTSLSAEEKKRIEDRELQEKLERIENRMVAKPVKSSSGSEGTGLTRESWMIVPPKPNLRAPVAQLKARQFSQKSTEEIVDQSIWTSTPETKEAAELEAARKLLLNNEKQMRESLKEEKAKQLAQSINAETRPQSLLEIHAESKTTTDISHKRFDRERDIVGRQMNSSKRDQLVKDAKVLDSKFAPSKFL